MSKCMVIVDVQREYSANYSGKKLFDSIYLEKIKRAIEELNVNSVFFVYDCNSSQITIPYQFLDMEEKYYTKRFYKNYAGMDIDTIEDYIENGENVFVVDDEAYMVYDELRIKTYNHHETQAVSESLEELIEELKNYNDIILCGGADGECLTDIEKVFDYFEVSFKKEKELVYPILDIKFEISEDEWIGIDCPY